MTTLAQQLANIGLYAIADALDDIIATATAKRLSPTQLFELVAQRERDDRTHRSLQRRLKRSKIGRFKPMTDFDWSWPSAIDRPGVDAALQLDFLQRTGNVVLVAAQGLGKTMIAKNIAYNAVLAGHPTRFASVAEVLLDLGAQDSSRALDRRLRYWSSIRLLVLDELGYLSYDNRNADLLFQLVSRRYENKSLVLTTNLAFKDWPSIFPNAACTTALIDRIVHHADIIHIEGQSYRRREAQSAASSRSQSRAKRAKP